MPRFLGELLASAARVKLTQVPFQGGALVVVNLLGAQIPIGFDTPAEFAENHRTGKPRVLALGCAQRSP